jgi:hypothetical protein
MGPARRHALGNVGARRASSTGTRSRSTTAETPLAAHTLPQVAEQPEAGDVGRRMDADLEHRRRTRPR